MKTIRAAASDIAAMVRERHPEKLSEVRRSVYAVETSCPEGRLLYHTLTGELLLLEPGESLYDPALRDELIERRFLVPPTLDEKKLCDQTRQVLRLTRRDDGHITRYVIFTTTDCNARCYYCFEKGQRRLYMRDATARDAADFMLRHSGGEKLSIRWFGGEPLVNRRAIDTISGVLRDSGVDYSANMFSNAYLFTPELVETARSLWKLNGIVVTLDGTEEVYNRTKAYVGVMGSAFKRVLDNIGHILDGGIRVTVNLNMDANNAEDLFHLADELGERFGGRVNFAARAGLLKEYVEPIPAFETRLQAVKRYRALNEKLSAYGIREKKLLNRALKVNACMADDPHCATILPDGRIGRCEHFGDREEVGSIYADAWDAEKLCQWRELRPAQAACADCFYYPQCLQLKRCNAVQDVCEAWYREAAAQDCENRMRCTWEKWKKTQSDAPCGNGDEHEN